MRNANRLKKINFAFAFYSSNCLIGKSLPQLLDNPFRRRVSSHVEVKNLAPSVLNHEEAIEQVRQASDQLPYLVGDLRPTTA